MPVRFKGDSEYHDHYKWLDSPKSATFSPTRQQSAPVAGLSSPNVSLNQGFMDEPAILRKKKPIPLVTTSTTKMFDEDIIVPDDYMLLGSQEKFTPNVPYKDYLTKNRARVLGTTYVPAKPIDFEELQPTPKKAPAKISFDTGAPKRKDEAVQVTGTAKPVNLSKTRVIAKEPASPVSSNGTASDRGHEKLTKASKTFAVREPKGLSVSPTEVVKHSSVPTQPSGQSVEPNQPKLPVEKPRRLQQQDKNIDSSYAMKYRAGVSPKRDNPKRKSEYEYKFNWKKPVDSTPLLAAEQVVHNRNSQIGPYKVSPPKHSEYRKEFKEWKYMPVAEDDSGVLQKRRLLQASKLRRTRSANDLTPDRRPPAGSPSRTHHDNARLTQSLNPQKPFFPHRRTVSWTTEYKSNFQPFTRYSYDQGAWQGAAPPHIKQQMLLEPDSKQTSGNWRAEVLELREKAEEYRKRSNGTHFSRAHVAQLLSENSKLWDAVSVSSELSALDLEQSPTSEGKKRKKDDKKRQRTQSAQASLKSLKQVNESVQTGEYKGPRRRLAMSSDGGRSTSPSDSARSICSASDPTISSITSFSNKPSKVPLTKAAEPGVGSGSDQGSKISSASTENGRVQTPELASYSVSNRHHLDITTPNRHGMILSSPPHSRQTGHIKSTPPVVKRGNTKVLQVEIPRNKCASKHQQISPTYGKPTPDTHCLLNEDVKEPVDMILETRYVQSPQANNRGNAYRPPIRTDDPWKYHRERQRETDECSEASQLSDSVMSVISATSSLASEVLERAAQRQQFWQKAKA
ncbi:nuclear protein MDM1-like [Watersipora subatra]|uniref:nuclear protein MDM1-like n=1 Tax=Watersipora subatra TaxID=2589382 RepID=UPI00355BFD12